MGVCASSSKALFNKLYELDESQVLGEGSFATVYCGKNKRTGEGIAIKRIDKASLSEDQIGKCWEDEVAMMQQCLPHGNIIELLHKYESPTHVYIVTELATGGELFQALISEGAYSEWDTKRFIRDVLEALSHMHEQQVVHRDIKPENLLLTSKDPKQARIKLGDFGSAMPINGTSFFSCQHLTWAYCAPEILRERQELKEKEVPPPPPTDKPLPTLPKVANPSATPKSDVWSVGIVLYVLLSGVHPFDSDGRQTKDQIISNIMRGKYSLSEPPLWESEVSNEAKSLLRLLLDPEASNRPTAKEALAHAWFHDPTTPKVALQVSMSNGLGQYQLLMQKKFRTSVIVALAAQSLRRSLMRIRSSKTASDGSLAVLADEALATSHRQGSANSKLFQKSASVATIPTDDKHSEQQSMDLIDEFDGDQAVREATHVE